MRTSHGQETSDLTSHRRNTLRVKLTANQYLLNTHIHMHSHTLIHPQTHIVVVVQLLSHVQIFVSPWTAACQASLCLTICLSLLKLMSIKLVMPSNHLILCPSFSSCPQSFLASWSFPVRRCFASGDQNIGASASASINPTNIQG